MRFFGFQFHSENFYSSSLSIPNRNRLIWENFIEICRQHQWYYSNARMYGLDFQEVKENKGEQNEKII